jgi:uncharacterized membrane protein YphA (DoxX/SURF4 family)
MFTAMVSLYMLAFCRVVIGLVFVVSSVSKVLHISQFRQVISNFHILPRRLCGTAAILFICGEFAVVVFVIIGGPLLLFGFALAIFLLLIFCVALISVLARQIQTSCNCFGPSEKPVRVTDVWRNLGFILCAFGGWATLAWTRRSPESLGVVEWLLIGICACIFVLLCTQLGEITKLFARD